MTTPDISYVEGSVQLPLSALTFPEEVDFIVDSFIKIDIAANHPTVEWIYPLQKSLHYGVYLTVSYRTCDKCVNQEGESNEHHHKAPLLRIPSLTYAKNVKVDDSLNIMHDVHKVDPDLPFVNIGASGLGVQPQEEVKEVM